jgi:hypothetical protein
MAALQPEPSPVVKSRHASWWRPVWPVLVLFGCLSLAVSWIVLLDYGPDEPYHVAYIHSLAYENRLPQRAQNHLVQHPPLFYGAMAVAWRLVGNDQPPLSITPGPQASKQMTPQSRTVRHVTRMLQTVLALLSLVLMARLLETLGVEKRYRRALIAFVAAWPMFGYISGVVNNENAAILWSSCLCLLIVRRVIDGTCTTRQAIILGALVGIGMLIKQTTLFVVPVALWAVWATGEGKQRLQRIVGFVGALVLAGMWWPLHNLLAVGDPFPSFTTPADQNGPAILAQPQVVLNYTRIIIETSFLPDWSWMFFPRELSTVAVALLGAVIIFLLITARGYLTPTHRQLQIMSIVAMLCLLLGILQYVVFKDRAAQVGGRYLLNGLPWLLTFLAISLPLRTAVKDEETSVEAASTAKAMPPILMAGAAAVVLLCLISAGWWFVVWTHYQAVMSGQWQG